MSDEEEQEKSESKKGNTDLLKREWEQKVKGRIKTWQTNDKNR